MLLTGALLCLASNIFFESRGEPLEGQIAVAAVTMNRARGDEDRVCKVVLKRKQFSWTIHRVKHIEAGPWVSKRPMVKEPKAWVRSLLLAQLVLWGVVPNVVGEAKFFHTTDTSPYWADHYTQVAQIGNHIFYK